MRKIAVTCALLVGGLSGWAVEYVVEGSLPGADGGLVYLSDYDNGERIDSARVSEGKFRMAGSYSRNAFAQVDFGQDFAYCVLDSSATVDFNTHLPKPGSSTLNDKVLELYNIRENMQSEMQSFVSHLKSKGLDEDAMIGAYIPFAKEMNGKMLAVFSNFIAENPNGVGEMAVIESTNWNLSPDDWETLYSKMPPQIKERLVTSKINEKYAQIVKSQPGKPFINFDAKTVDGKPTSLADYVGKGKYVLVDFWASWCGPCRKEAKEVLKPLYERYKDNPRFEILGVAVWEEPEATLRAIKTLGYPWPQIVDAGMLPMELYGFDGIPMIILFGPDGKIVARNLRGKELVGEVEKALSDHP